MPVWIAAVGAEEDPRVQYNYYRIGAGTLLAIACAVAVGVALAVVLRRRFGVAATRAAWIAAAAVSAATALLITLAPSGRGGTYPCEFDPDGSLFGWLHGNQSTANVALMIPVAVALPLATRDTRWHPWSYVALVALPLLIELVQASMPLGRACDGMDVVDNWIGVGIGCLIGTVGARCARALGTRRGSAAPSV
jgi:hypothetical protein